MNRRIQARLKAEGGFTLIELLVVMIIIGILAAVAIPLFLSQRKKAEDAAAKADVSTLGKEIATYFVDEKEIPTLSFTGGQYFIDGNLVGNASKNVVMPLSAPEGNSSSSWCVYVTNAEGDTAVTGYQYSSIAGLQPGNCAITPGNGTLYNGRVTGPLFEAVFDSVRGPGAYATEFANSGAATQAEFVDTFYAFAPGGAAGDWAWNDFEVAFNTSVANGLDYSVLDLPEGLQFTDGGVAYVVDSNGVAQQVG